jgi:hypothetical protein
LIDDRRSPAAWRRETVPDYERLQDETVAATGTDAQRVLQDTVSVVVGW